MWPPFVHTEGASSIGTSIAYSIPTSGVGAISIGVAHEGAPTWTTLLVPVANRMRLDPELDGAIREAFLEDIGNGEAGLLRSTATFFSWRATEEMAETIEVS